MTANSLRDKTQAVRRAHVLQAALGVFAERGFRRATIRDIARAAGVSDGTIYNIFANKTALLLALLEPLEPAMDEPPPTGADLAELVSALTRRRWEDQTPENLAMLRVVLAEVLVDAELRALFFARVLKPVLDGAESLFAAHGGDREGAMLDARIITGQLLGLLLLRLLDDAALEAAASAVPGRLAGLYRGGLASHSEDR